MAITVRELLTTWGFDVNSKPIDKLNRTISDTKQVVQLVGAQAIAGAGALFGLSASVASAGDEFAKTSRRIGLSVETLQEYGHVAQLAGSSQAEMTRSIEDLTLSMAEARKGGGKLIEPLIRLNQLTGRDLLTNMTDADQLMLDLADTFSVMTDETEKAELATKIFGGTGLEMVNVLSQGSAAIREQRMEAHNLGVVMGEDVTKRAEFFQDTLVRLKQVFLGLRNEIGGELMPIVTDVMTAIREWVMINRDLVKSGLTKFITILVKGTREFIELMSRMLRVIRGAILTFGGYETVLKNVLFAIGTLTAVKFLSAIGNLTQAIAGGLVQAFRMLGNAALLTNAKMLAIPVIVGAIVAAIFLLVEDVVAFFQGRDSVTGKIVKAFQDIDIEKVIKEKLDAAIDVIQKFGEEAATYIAGIFDLPNLEEDVRVAVEGALTSIGEFFEGLTFGNLGERLEQMFIDAIAGDTIVSKIIGLFLSVFQAIGNIVITTIGGIVETAVSVVKGAFSGALDFSGPDGILTKATETLKTGISDAASFFGFGDDESPTGNNLAAAGVTGQPTPRPPLTLIPGGQSKGSVNQTNNQTVNATVNVPAGTTPEDAAAIVEQGITDALNKTARETQAAVETNVER